MKLTSFGRLVRKLRIELDLTLGEMAKEIGISTAYLSAMETGRRPVTEDVVASATKFFKRKGIDAGELRSVVDRQSTEVNVARLAADERALVAAFARKVTSLNPEKRGEIEKILWDDA